MVLKSRETKRYEFEAVNSSQANEIVHKIVYPDAEADSSER
jgi:hypothetical protein